MSHFVNASIVHGEKFQMNVQKLPEVIMLMQDMQCVQLVLSALESYVLVRVCNRFLEDCPNACPCFVFHFFL